MTRSDQAHPAAAPSIARLRFEHLSDAGGIGVAAPRLSWETTTDTPGWQQTAYEVEALAPDGQSRGHTGLVSSDQSVLVAWPFAPLASRERVAVRVRVWGDDGSQSDWSAPATVEAGLLHPGDWSARFISPDWDEDTSRAQPAPLLRRAFSVRAGVARARLYITSLGVYEAQLNGAPVGDHVLAPGWTSYKHRLRYQTFDVTGLLREGDNAIGATLGDGWFRGRLSFGGGRRNLYGDRLALLAQLEIAYADGSVERVISDDGWRAATGPVLASDIYDGETYDARLEREGWSDAGYDDSDWAGVRFVERDLATLVAPSGPPVRRTQTLAPVDVFAAPSGRTILDFGQNLVGRLRIRVRGEAGQTVTLRHAEVLEDGELATRPLRHAAATDRYTLRGGEEEIYEPHFTFHGFRYADVEGWPGELVAGAIEAVVCHSDLERTGWFECSDPLINRLHENVVWSMRGNFLDIPTDCPQRDERLGWTGDIQVFSPTACFLYDTAGFLSTWLQDLAAEQREFGVVPFVVPSVIGDRANPPAAAWGDAACVVPWVLYQRYGDTGVLAAQFDSMRAWVDLLADVAGERRLWDAGFQFGDWLDPSAPPDNPGAAKADSAVVATAYFAHSTELVAQAARVLGRADDAERYAALAQEVRDAFGREYVTPSGRVLSDAPTVYAQALGFALLPTAEQRQYAGERLAALARASGYRISTGFVGTPLICDALCSVGQHAAAFRLLTQRECPSWLYPVTMGATTIWERWDSMLPDGSVNPGEMTSFNHYALGAVADWLHRAIAGLAPAAPGYRQIAVAPLVGGGLTHARARHHTPYGVAEAGWQLDGGQLTVEVVVPPGAAAVVTLPQSDRAPFTVTAGAHRWQYPYAILQASPPPRSTGDTVDQFIDDPDALALASRLMAQHMPGFAGAVWGRLASRGHESLRGALGMMPGAGQFLDALDAALAPSSGGSQAH